MGIDFNIIKKIQARDDRGTIGRSVDQDEFGAHGHDQDAMIIGNEAGMIAETWFVEFPDGLEGAGVEAVNLFATHSEKAVVGDDGRGGVGREVCKVSVGFWNDLAV